MKTKHRYLSLLFMIFYLGVFAQTNNPQINYLDNNSAIINYLDENDFLVQSQFIDDVSHIHIFNNSNNTGETSESFGDESLLDNIVFPTQELGIRPYEYCFNSINHKYYIYGGDQIIIYNSLTNELITKLNISSSSDIKPTEIYPNYKSIIYNEFVNKIYCVTPDNTLLIIDGETDEQSLPINLGDFEGNVFRSIYLDQNTNSIFVVLNVFTNTGDTYSNLFKYSLTGELTASQYYNFRIDDIVSISEYKMYASTTMGVYKIDPNDLSEYSQIDNGKPSELIYAVNENKVYSSSCFSQELIVIDVINDETVSIAIDFPIVITEGDYNPINKKVYFSAYCFEFLTSHLFVVSTESNEILNQIDFDNFWGGLKWIEMNGVDNRLYFSDSEKLYLMSGNTNTITEEISQNEGATRRLGFNPELEQVIILKTDKAYFEINSSSLNSTIDIKTTGGWCETSAYDANEDKIYVTDNNSINEKISLSIYDGTDYNLIASFGEDFSPINIHYSDVSEKTYVLTDEGEINILNAVNNTIEETLSLDSDNSLNILTSDNEYLYTASYNPDKISCFDLESNNRTDLLISTGKPTKIVFGDQENIYLNSGIEDEPRILNCIHNMNNVDWSITRDDNDFLIYSPIDKSVFIQKDDKIVKIDGNFGTPLDELSLENYELIDGIYHDVDNSIITIVKDDFNYQLWKLSCVDLSFTQNPINIPEGLYNNMFVNHLNNRLYLYLAFEYSDFKTKLLSFDPESLQQLGSIELGPQRCLTDLNNWLAPSKIKPSLNSNSNQLIIPNWAYSNFSVVQCPEEERTFKNGWNWVSFPKLDRENDDPVDLAPLLNTMEPMPNQMLVQHRLNTENNPMTDAFYNGSIGQWTFNELENLQSTKGYKIEITDGNDEFQLTTPGTRLDPAYPISLAGNMVENWIGYFENRTSDPFDALEYCIDNLRWIKGQYWSAHYEVIDVDKGSPVYGWIMSRPQPLKYGDMLVVQGINDCELIWNQEAEPGGKKKAETSYFEYEEQADYTSIFIELDNTTDVIEIGAFVDETCVGATVVEEGDSLVEIQTYLQGAEGDELYFQTYSPNKSAPTNYPDYYVKDFNTFQYVNRKIRPYDQKPFHMVSFKNEVLENQENLIVYHYPNPANEEVNIHFNLQKEQQVSLELMDINGKLIERIDLGNYPMGTNEYSYKIPQVLSKGVYLYKFITENTTVVNQLIIQ